MIKFSIRDLLWLTALIAVLTGWIVDRSKLAWRYDEAGATMERLRAALDAADPEWRIRLDRTAAIDVSFYRGGYVAAIGVAALVVLVIILMWQGYLHWSTLSRARR